MATSGDEFFEIQRDEERGIVTGCEVRNNRPSFMSGGTTLCGYGILTQDDPDRQTVADLVAAPATKPTAAQEDKAADAAPATKPSSLPPVATNGKLSRAMACFVGMALGDSLGSPMEFRPVNYDDDHPVLKGFDKGNGGNFGLAPGMWTDDASMGACIADSLLWKGGFDPYDLKVRFVNWWNYGYNNAFRYAPGGHSHSVGLGGNISMSFDEFVREGTVFTTAGDKNTSGNGSIMRNGACAVYYHDDLEKALEVARQQSYTTHQGTEAAECCAALTYICHYAINHPNAGKEEILGHAISQFKAKCNSVQCLVESLHENEEDPNRDWRWRSPKYHYAPGRAKSMPGYVGSYAMDNLAMSLHCVWTTDSFEAALLKVANRCGDADSVCAVAGQIAGAIYGWENIPQDWHQTLNQWDKQEFAIKAWKMFHKRPARVPAAPVTDNQPSAEEAQ